MITRHERHSFFGACKADGNRHQKGYPSSLPDRGVCGQKEKEKDPWNFRIKADGGKYWINQKEMIASFNYPYLKELIKAIDNHRASFKMEGTSVALKELNPLQVLTELSSQPEVVKSCRANSLRVECLNPANGNLPQASKFQL